MAIAPLLIAAALASPVEGQSLAEAARREQERRRARPEKAVPTFTDADLGRAEADSPAPDGAEPKAAERSASPSPDRAETKQGMPDDPEERRWLEQRWRTRFAEARARLREAESRAYVERIGVAWNAGIPYQTVIRETVETEALKKARSGLADLEEELRRAGLPPGWGRE